MKLYTLLLAVLMLIPIGLASHTDTTNPCTDSDCPLWLRGQGYNSHTYIHTDSYDRHRPQTRYWHEDVNYVISDVYHPPKHYYVHYNENFYRHFGYGYQGYYSTQRSSLIHRGNGFTRYY